MRKNIFALFGGLFVAATLFFTACESDPCAKTDCGVHGTCNSGVCDCATGYETDPGNGRCDVISREKFYGTYSLSETCTDKSGATVTAKYDVIISDSLDTPDKITTDLLVVGINGLGGYGCIDAGTKKPLAYHVKANINKSAISIDEGTAACNTKFAGSGSIDVTNKIITLEYTANYTDDKGVAQADKCKAELTKK